MSRSRGNAGALSRLSRDMSRDVTRHVTRPDGDHAGSVARDVCDPISEPPCQGGIAMSDVACQDGSRCPQDDGSPIVLGLEKASKGRSGFLRNHTGGSAPASQGHGFWTPHRGAGKPVSSNNLHRCDGCNRPGARCALVPCSRMRVWCKHRRATGYPVRWLRACTDQASARPAGFSDLTWCPFNAFAGYFDELAPPELIKVTRSLIAWK